MHARKDMGEGLQPAGRALRMKALMARCMPAAEPSGLQPAKGELAGLWAAAPAHQAGLSSTRRSCAVVPCACAACLLPACHACRCTRVGWHACMLETRCAAAVCVQHAVQLRRALHATSAFHMCTCLAAAHKQPILCTGQEHDFLKAMHTVSIHVGLKDPPAKDLGEGCPAELDWGMLGRHHKVDESKQILDRDLLLLHRSGYFAGQL